MKKTLTHQLTRQSKPKQSPSAYGAQTLVLFLICLLFLDQSEALCSDLKTFGDSLDEVKTLFTGKAWSAGMAVATVIGMIYAGAKVSTSAAMGVAGIGIGATVYLKWLLG